MRLPRSPSRAVDRDANGLLPALQAVGLRGYRPVALSGAGWRQSLGKGMFTPACH